MEVAIFHGCLAASCLPCRFCLLIRSSEKSHTQACEPEMELCVVSQVACPAQMRWLGVHKGRGRLHQLAQRWNASLASITSCEAHLPVEFVSPPSVKGTSHEPPFKPPHIRFALHWRGGYRQPCGLTQSRFLWEFQAAAMLF